MRIIGGTHKSRRLSPPKGLPVRPTTDYAKEGLFNVLRNRIDIEECNILDLCAGTGSMSLEFASRGAKKVLAIDQNYSCIKYIKKVAKELGLNAILAQKAELFHFLKQQHNNYDIIFADPPYGIEQTEELPSIIFEESVLAEGGYFILEHGAKYNFEEHPHFSFSKRYGNVNFTFFE